MKPECKVNQGELGSIVRDMLAEKNHVGRQAFNIMKEAEVVEEGSERLSMALYDAVINNDGIDKIRIKSVRGNEEYIPYEIWTDGKTLVVSVIPEGEYKK